jgi:type VI secretion system secreted protein VgrG
MAAPDTVMKNRLLRMDGDYTAPDLFLKSAVVRDGISRLTETTVEFMSKNKALKLEEVVGYSLNLIIEKEDGSERKFLGTCISAEYIGLYQGYGLFQAEVRPWLWFLTRRQNCKVFQELSVVDIIKEVLAHYGFDSHLDNKLSGTYKPRLYCVQYRESDFDFICRLMEEEGIYYFFGHESGDVKMVLADSVSAYQAVEEGPDLQFFFREEQFRRRADHIFEWTAGERVTSGKVTLNDYNFEAPQSPLKSTKAMAKGKHAHKMHEVYDYPGHYRKGPLGENYAKVKIEAKAIRHQTWNGAGNVRTLEVGRTFKLKDHPRGDDKTDFLIAAATYYLQIETDYEDADTRGSITGSRLEFDPENRDTYRCVFEVVPKASQYRAPLQTPWPEIGGMHTAVVTGPAGDEIYTDKYGRIKVQFHWDRIGEKDDKSSCWVRTVMPWTGKGWGMMAVPRIGQEVVIQFEEGDPDRPVCTGMLYNADTMPPWELPANMTQSGVRTSSSKGGGGFNELMMEDKKDEELVRFQAEKDYRQIVKNNADITIGLEKTDKGNLTQTIHANKVETIKTGDHTFKVETGNQKIFIKTDLKETVEGKATQEVTGHTSQTVITGNYTQDIQAGNLTRKVGKGNEDVSFGKGNYSLKAAAGKITLEAATSIELKVGGSSIKITPAGIELKSTKIDVNATGMLTGKSPKTTIKGDAMLTLKGGVTMIN